MHLIEYQARSKDRLTKTIAPDNKTRKPSPKQSASLNSFADQLIYMYFVTVVNFLSQLIFISPLFLDKVMYANEFETKEKQKLTKIKN